jgi:hypothetical protein
MKISTEKFFFGLLSLVGILILSSCGGWEEPAARSDERPVIYPDYIGVTVPSNIAPLNFMVEGCERIQASISFDGKEFTRVAGNDGVICLDEKDWKDILHKAEGDSIQVYVSVWNEEFPQGQAYAPFSIYIAKDSVDEWIAYRLIEPGYRSWRQIGLYQRDLSSFEEKAIVTNATENETCLNCHHFPAYSSESMMFHARGAEGGTILYHNGKLT